MTATDTPRDRLKDDLEWLAEQPAVPTVTEVGGDLLRLLYGLWDLGEWVDGVEFAAEHDATAYRTACELLALIRRLEQMARIACRSSVNCGPGTEDTQRRIADAIRYVIETLTKVDLLAQTVEGADVLALGMTKP
jgi:hypothetical protein